MVPMSVFWHRVCRWITNCFSSTKLACLHREACLPPLPVLVRHQRRLAGLRLICSPPEINPAAARLPKSVPTFSPHRASSTASGKITSQPYLFFNLDWRTAPDKIKNPRYRHNAITALANAAALNSSPTLYGSGQICCSKDTPDAFWEKLSRGSPLVGKS